MAKLIKLPRLNLDKERPLKDVFKSHAEDGVRDQLEPRCEMCDDCAMKGFYNEMAEELRKEDVQTQDDVLKSWFCHNDTDSMCRGIYNYIHRMRGTNSENTTVR